MDKENKKISAGEETDIAYKVLLEPWVTEASTLAMELNKYVFKINPNASKAEIKRAIQDLYKVTVKSVNTVKIPQKSRNYGKTPGWKKGFKKAIVTLKEGDKIELFDTN